MGTSLKNRTQKNIYMGSKGIYSDQMKKKDHCSYKLIVAV